MPRRCAPSEDQDAVTLEGRADFRAEAVDLAEIDRAADDILQHQAGRLHADEGAGARRLYLNRKIEIAGWGVVSAGAGPEHREMAHAAAAEVAQRLRRCALRLLIEAVILGDGRARHVETVRHPIAAGARRDNADRQGHTPLDLARGRCVPGSGCCEAWGGVTGYRVWADAARRASPRPRSASRLKPARVGEGEVGGEEILPGGEILVASTS